MSMLTPPGMGGKYRIKGDRYPRMRRPRGRRRRSVAAASAAVVTLGVLGWGTLQLVDIFSGSGPSQARAGASGSTDCPTTAAAGGTDGKAEGKGAGAGEDAGGEAGRSAAAKPAAGAERLPKPGSITVNVLNATQREGLAKRTADELQERGFKIGDVSNAPKELGGDVKSAGLLLGAPGKETAASFKVLDSQVAAADTKYDEREGKDVDLVLGDAFKGLTPQKEAEKTLVELRQASPEPTPSTC